MRRHKQTNGTLTRPAAPADKTDLPPVPTVHKDNVYTVDQAQAALGLKRSSLRREIRSGRLRVSKRAGRHFLLGAWLLEWLEAGEVRRRARDESGPNGAMK